jgi:membrane protein YdbS with pleckstrin-like domain
MYAKPRMPDLVRSAAVRAVITVALTLVLLMAAVLCTLAGAWSAFPMALAAVAAVVVATWSVLDVWITRQVWRQRDGVVSTPRTTARTAPREVRTTPRRDGGRHGSR